jgi:hypothetical protein
MNLSFVNGTQRQQQQWKQALGSLLNFQIDAVPIVVEVEFVDPGEVSEKGHNDLANTTWEYDSPTSSTRVRNDAPGYGEQRKSMEALAASMGLTYNADVHFNETAVHEFAHSLFAALPEEHRVKIAQMFGAANDSLSELMPEGVPWEDRIMEGIAETFKEAFLPRRLRVFPNRTNRRIPYNVMPQFRALWRTAVPDTIVEEGPAEELPAFSEVIQRGSKTHPFLSLESNTFLQELLAACGVTDDIFGAEPPSEVVYPLLQGRRYSAAEIFKALEEQTPYLKRLRKEGKDLSVFLWMHAFSGGSVGEELTEIAYEESGKKNKSPIPIGTRVKKWFDFDIRIVWRKADGSLYPGDKFGFRYENEEELVSYPEEVRPPWGNWVNVGTVFEEFFYNDELSENPSFSEHPELDFTIPSDAAAIAGFLIGVETYREVFLTAEGGPPFFEKTYSDIFRAREGRPERLDFEIPGFTGGVIVGEAGEIEVPDGEIRPGFTRQGVVPSRRPVVGR